MTCVMCAVEEIQEDASEDRKDREVNPTIAEKDCPVPGWMFYLFCVLFLFAVFFSSVLFIAAMKNSLC